MTTKQLQKYMISFIPKKNKDKQGHFFFSEAIKNIVKRKKTIPQDLSSSVDKIVYGI